MHPAKDLLRAEMKKQREALATAQPRAGDTLAEAVTGDLEVMRLWPDTGAIIAGYWPIQTEINPLPLLQGFAARGYAVALPALVEDANAPNGYRMIFRTYRAGSTLGLGPFNIAQPGESEAECLPDVVFTPLLAFDARGSRLGYGGGYYDRALSFLKTEKRCMAIGLAFAGQLVDALPTEAFDQTLDMIFTENGIIRLD